MPGLEEEMNNLQRMALDPLVTPRTGKQKGETWVSSRGIRKVAACASHFAVVETKKLSFKCEVIQTAKRKQESKEAEETLPSLGRS